jgi:1-deoxy-D-xylulose-5-phosphate synthase
VTFAAGLACEGLKPVVAIYSTFLQRAYDQLVHDVALQNLPVVFAVDRGGLVGADGPTHHGTFDLSFVTCIPNMVVMAPADEAECRRCCRRLCAGRPEHGALPARRRHRRHPGNAESRHPAVGKGEIRRHGKACRPARLRQPGPRRLAAGDELDATVANMRFVKPLDAELIVELAGNHSLLVSIEENAVIGGAGSEIERVLAERGLNVPVLRLGLPDRFIDHGEQGQLLAELGLDKDGIVHAPCAARTAKQ